MDWCHLSFIEKETTAWGHDRPTRVSLRLSDLLMWCKVYIGIARHLQRSIKREL